MKIEQILQEIKSLSMSQGSWGRLYRDLMEIKENDKSSWEEVVKDLEEENFETTLDIILYFEEGKSSKVLTDQEKLENVLEQQVQVYHKSDFSDDVYIYNNLAYIGETGFQNLLEQIKDDYEI